MSVLKSRKGFMLIEILVAMKILLLASLLICQSYFIIHKSNANINEKKEIVEMMEESKNIILYNTEFSEINTLINKKLYITDKDLENYKGGGIGTFLSSNGKSNSEKLLVINFLENEQCIKVKMEGISKNEKMPIIYEFFKGNY